MLKISSFVCYKNNFKATNLPNSIKIWIELAFASFESFYNFCMKLKYYHNVKDLLIKQHQQIKILLCKQHPLLSA